MPNIRVFPRSRLDLLVDAQAHLGQAIERLERASDMLEGTEADLAKELVGMASNVRNFERLILDLQDAEPEDPQNAADWRNEEERERDFFGE